MGRKEEELRINYLIGYGYGLWAVGWCWCWCSNYTVLRCCMPVFQWEPNKVYWTYRQFWVIRKILLSARGVPSSNYAGGLMRCCREGDGFENPPPPRALGEEYRIISLNLFLIWRPSLDVATSNHSKIHVFLQFCFLRSSAVCSRLQFTVRWFAKNTLCKTEPRRNKLP